MKEEFSQETAHKSMALHKAVVSGNVVLVKLLLWTGSNVNAKNYCKQTSLHLACESDNFNKKVLKQLLKSRVDVNAQDEKGETALHLTCKSYQKNNKKIVELLLKFGANINAQNKVGKTALHMACWSGNRDNMLVLLKNGAKVDLVDNDGLSPLHAVAYSVNCDSSLTKLLLRKKVNVNATDFNGMSTLHFLVWRPNTEESIGAILENGGDVNLQDSKGNTPLHIACESKMKEVVCLLLDKGAKVELKNLSGMTALHLATLSVSLNIMDVLISQGADVNAKDHYGNTPLHLAFSLKSKCTDSLWVHDIVKMLLEKGAKVDVKNSCLITPYEESVIFLQPFYPTESQNCPHEFSKRLQIEKVMIEHIIKLKSVKQQVEVDIKTKLESDIYYTVVQNRCSLELDYLRSTNIYENFPASELLLQPNQPYLPTDDGTKRLQKIEEFLRSPDLLKMFPMYGHLLRITFEKNKLMTMAVQSFYVEGRKQIVKELPCLIPELIVTFLSEEDLRNFIRSEKRAIK